MSTKVRPQESLRQILETSLFEKANKIVIGWNDTWPDAIQRDEATEKLDELRQLSDFTKFTIAGLPNQVAQQAFGQLNAINSHVDNFNNPQQANKTQAFHQLLNAIDQAQYILFWQLNLADRSNNLIETQTAKVVEDLDTRLGNLVTHLGNIENKTDEHSRAKIGKILAKGFSERADDMKHSPIFWAIITILLAVVILCAAILDYVCLGVPDYDGLQMLYYVISRVGISGVSLLLLYFCMRQRGRERALVEDYRNKAAIAGSISTYLELGKGDSHVLMQQAAQVIFKEPTHFVKGELSKKETEVAVDKALAQFKTIADAILRNAGH